MASDDDVRSCTGGSCVLTLSSVTMVSVTASGGTLRATSDQAGVIYYSILAAAVSAPDAATIKAGNTKVVVGTPGQAATTSIAGLTASTAYKMWVVAYDSGGTVPSAVTSTSFTTSAFVPTCGETTSFTTSAFVPTCVCENVYALGTGYLL